MDVDEAFIRLQMNVFFFQSVRSGQFVNGGIVAAAAAKEDGGVGAVNGQRKVFAVSPTAGGWLRPDGGSANGDDTLPPGGGASPILFQRMSE
uniref:Uncharacterized protein n=1 Tax=Globodera rostochiensis TaxID=31243 RepID=A0A914HDW6_GLORO